MEEIEGASWKHEDRIMTRIVVDEALLSRLHNLAEPLELCDASGRVLGRFVPEFDPAEYEGLEPQISDEELDRRSQSRERMYTTDEVLAYLEGL
jgi:hypothetical protein